MNAAARVLAEGSFTENRFRTFVFSVRNLLLGVLVSIVIVNAFSVIYVTDLNRRLFGELQVLRQTHDELCVEWGQLLLEQTTWATQARIQKIALNNLDMTMPASQSIVVIKQ